MYIVAIAWIYVVLMMAITEHTIIAGIMTFLLYGVLPLSIILYLMGTSARKKRRAAVKNIPLSPVPPTPASAPPQAQTIDISQEN